MVVTTYNRCGGLRDALSPLLADDEALELIVVDDGSTDDTRDLLGALATCHGRLRPLIVANGGEMRARAAGAEVATGDVVLFLDDDVVARPGLLRAHRRRHAGGRARVVVGYMPVRAARVTVTTALYAAEYEGRCRAYAKDAGSILLNLWAGNFSMPRAQAVAVGLADSAYRERYHPDRDLGLRCRAHGMEAVFAREATAEHRYARPLRAFVRDSRSQGTGRVLLHRLHAEPLGPLPEMPGVEGLPRPVRLALRVLSRSEPGYRVGEAGLLALARALPTRRARTRATRLLRRLAQARGARDAFAR